MTAKTVNERLARLESSEQQVLASQKAMNVKLDTLNDRFNRYEARWGGVMMVVSALVALALAFKDEILRIFRGG